LTQNEQTHIGSSHAGARKGSTSRRSKGPRALMDGELVD